MRPLEIVLALALAVCIAAPLVWAGSRPRWIRFLPAVALALALLQLLVERYRWQMIPLYGLAVLLFLLSIPALLRPAQLEPASHRRAIAGAGLGLLLLVACAALPILLPVPQMIRPTGPYPVGTVDLEMVDTSRQEIYSANPQDPRRLMVTIWYPANPPAGAATAPWIDHLDVVGPAICTWMGMPPFTISHVNLAGTNSYPGVPVNPAQAAYPVLLFSHGWAGFRNQNTYQAENLASNGYIVVAVQHTYAATTTVFPDGTLALHNPAGLPDGVSAAEFDAAANRLLNQWAGDLGFVLDQLALLNQKDPAGRLTGRMDLQQVGVFGHSTGGGATIEFCARDDRCKAGLTMDAYMAPVSKSVLDSGLQQPFLFLFSEKWPSAGNTSLFNRLRANLPNPYQVMTITGTNHYDFTDIPQLSPVASAFGLKGPLNGTRGLRIINDYSLAFFNQALKGENSSLLTGPSPSYPEVVWDTVGKRLY